MLFRTVGTAALFMSSNIAHGDAASTAAEQDSTRTSGSFLGDTFRSFSIFNDETEGSCWQLTAVGAATLGAGLVAWQCSRRQGAQEETDGRGVSGEDYAQDALREDESKKREEVDLTQRESKRDTGSTKSGHRKPRQTLTLEDALAATTTSTVATGDGGGLRITDDPRIAGAHHRKKRSRYDSTEFAGEVNSVLKVSVPMYFDTDQYPDSAGDDDLVKEFLDELGYDVQFLVDDDGRRFYRMTKEVKDKSGHMVVKTVDNYEDGIEAYDAFKAAYEAHKSQAR